MRTASRVLAAAGALAAAAWSAGCDDDPDPAGQAPAPSPSSTAGASSTPSGGTPKGGPSPAQTLRALPGAEAGSDGLTVRYLNRDGTISTLPVEDFRR